MKPLNADIYATLRTAQPDVFCPLCAKNYGLSAELLAPALLGKTLRHECAAGVTAGIIVEAEAYCGPDDPASHAHRGPPDGRVAAMFGPGGHAYVYLIYGMYCCFNVVAGPPGHGVLIRALQPTEGLDIMAARRFGAGESPLPTAWQRGLCSGPGKLTAAMGITRAHYGIRLWDSALTLGETPGLEAFEMDASPRIGIDYAGEAAAWKYRFTVRGSPWLSRKG